MNAIAPEAASSAPNTATSARGAVRIAAAALALAFAATLAGPMTAAAEDLPPTDAPAAEDPAPAGSSPDPTPTGSGETATWSAAPADTPQEDDRVSFRFAVEAGQTVRDVLVVTNRGARPLELAVYASDGVTSSGGQFDLLARADTPKDVGAWVRLDADSVAVEPGESATVPFTLTVPANATPGDHPGGIATALVSEGQTVSVERRVGVRIHVRVEGELRPSLTLEDVGARASEPAPWRPSPVEVSAVAVNTGNVRLGFDTEVVATGLFGWRLGSVAGPQIREVIPGQSLPFTVEVPRVWPLGPVTLSLRIEPHSVGEDPDPGPIPSVSATARTWLVPWPWLGALGFVLALLILWRRRRRAVARAIARARQEGAAAERAKLVAPQVSSDPE